MGIVPQASTDPFQLAKPIEKDATARDGAQALLGEGQPLGGGRLALPGVIVEIALEERADRADPHLVMHCPVFALAGHHRRAILMVVVAGRVAVDLVR